MNIEIIAASPRKESVTYRVALFLQKYMSEKTEHNVNIIDVRDWAFPLMQQEVFSTFDKAPEHLQPLAKRILEADAFILITPEYNGSYSPHLKNLLDHFPKQFHKSFAIVTGSPGATGGIRAALALQLLVNALFGIASPYLLVIPQIEKKFSADAELLDPNFENAVHTFVTEFLWLAEKIAT